MLWTFVDGEGGNWLCFDANQRVWRYDDGSLLLKKDQAGRLSPVVPPVPVSPGMLQIVSKPGSIVIANGQAVPFSSFKLGVKNTGDSPLYRLNMISALKQKSPLVFYQPETVVVLKPGETVELEWCLILGRWGNRYRTGNALS